MATQQVMTDDDQHIYLCRGLHLPGSGLVLLTAIRLIHFTTVVNILVKNIFLSGNILICVLMNSKQDMLKKEACVADQIVEGDTGSYSVILSQSC